jgi:hypothetical protein
MTPALLAQGSTVGGSGTGPSGPPSGSPGGSCSVATRQISLHIPDEFAPAGGVVQMKVLVTEPSPVSSGGPRFAALGGAAVRGIQLFNPAGDVNGVAMVSSSMVSLAYISSTGTQGSDYPIMTVALQLPANLSPGTKLPFSLDASSSWTLGLLGTATMKPIPPATITVGGSISVTDIVPGGGLQPAGTVISVRGIGFQPGTQVQLSNIKANSISVVSPQEIQIVLAEATQMTGKKIQVTNPDGSSDTYFSYMRGVPLGQSNQSLLASAVPIFSSTSYSQAVFSSGELLPSEFNGVAVQNPNMTQATVTFTLFSSSNVALGSSTMVIPSGNRIMRETSELAGCSPQPGSYLVVSSDTPVQMFGFEGDNVTAAVVPYVALSSQP